MSSHLQGLILLDSLIDVKKLIVISWYLEETSYLIQKAKKRSLACRGADYREFLTKK